MSGHDWGDLRPAPRAVPFPKDPYDDGRCHDWVWVYDAYGKYRGETDCLLSRGHVESPVEAERIHQSLMYRWRPGSRRIYTAGVRQGAHHDPRRGT